MEFKNTLLVTADMEKAVAFYEAVLGLEVILDFGANKTLTGGLCLQTGESYREFIGGQAIAYGGKDFELYFEEDDFGAFADKLSNLAVAYVHPVIEHRWGQRVVRFFDPDGHIIEVGENMKSVVRRFLDSGMTAEAVAARMDVPLSYVEAAQKG